MAEPEVKRIVKETLAMIDFHRLRPGDRLPSERDLAERLGVGRGAVREALTVLETVRLVERRRSAGFFLREAASESLEALVLCADFGLPLSEAQVRNAVEMRRILELQAVRLACERRDEDDLARMSNLLQQSEEALAEGRSMAAQDAQFHLAIVAATQNDTFSRVVNSFFLMSRARREVYFQDAGQGRRSHAQHRALFQAIERQDAKAAVSLLEKHLQGVEAFWLSTLTEPVEAETPKKRSRS